MNIFEGSRRIAYLAGVLAVAGVLFPTGTHEPYLSATYSISNPQATFQRVEEDCPSEAGLVFFDKKSQSGETVHITLCLLTMAFGESKQQLIPYKIDENDMVWGAEKYSTDVSAYEKILENRFNIPIEDNAWIEKEKSRLYWDNWKGNLSLLGSGLIIYVIFVWAIGWIVRGFMGIPHSMDSKPSNNP